jgi:hypothetical protein
MSTRSGREAWCFAAESDEAPLLLCRLVQGAKGTSSESLGLSERKISFVYTIGLNRLLTLKITDADWSPDCLVITGIGVHAVFAGSL